MKGETRNVRPEQFGELSSQLSKVLLGSAHSHEKTSRQLKREKQRKSRTSVVSCHV